MKHTPMQKQYLDLKRQYPDCILMFRLGDFYEMFNQDARVASEILEIVLTSRGEGVDKWPMCGVPYHSVQSYIAKLLDSGHTVAIADQVEDASQAKGLVKREIVRVITPGTVIESNLLEESTNNYLVTAVSHEGLVGIAAVDVSTGEFLATEFEAKLTDEKTISEICRLNPSEILLQESTKAKDEMKRIADELRARITYRNDLDFSSRNAEQRLKEELQVATLEGYGIAEKKVALGAAGATMAYLREVLKSHATTIASLTVYSVDSHMVVDATTQKNLELIKNARDGSNRGTLLSVISRAVTPMGRRRMKQWILQPLCDIDSVQERLDAVEELSRSAIFRKTLIETLRPLGDLERITSRIIYGSSNARDLLALRNALELLPKVKDIMKEPSSNLLKGMHDQLNPLKTLCSTLTSAIVEDPPTSVREGGMIRKGFSKKLDELKDSIASDKKWIASLQNRERNRTGIKSLKVGYNKVFGYYIEVTKSNLSNVPDDYERKQTLTGAERFVTPELKEKEAAVLAGEDRINALEYEIYEELRAKIAEAATSLRTNATAVATIDALSSLAEVAVTRRYVRPKLTDGTTIRIVEGRHPAMEIVLGANEFVPNSVEIGDGGNTLIIVTGPNMSGKSTFMRQTALITLMAQMGSFVPAKSAEIGIVDRIFTRVGAFDDLTARQSTFMVEMIETANILNTATERSLVILDEIGRGTSTFDGMALAWAVAEEIVKMKTRTLFATHFHQLTDMARIYHGVKNVHVLARELGNSIVFLHKIVDGGTDRSYGVHVAALAGVPNHVVQRAREMLLKLERENVVQLAKGDFSAEESVQASLEPLTVEDPLVEQIKHMDLDRTTPIDALVKLREFQDTARKREN